MGADKVSLVSLNMLRHSIAELKSHNTNVLRQNFNMQSRAYFFSINRTTHVEGDRTVYSAYWQTYTYIYIIQAETDAEN